MMTMNGNGSSMDYLMQPASDALGARKHATANSAVADIAADAAVALGYQSDDGSERDVATHFAFKPTDTEIFDMPAEDAAVRAVLERYNARGIPAGAPVDVAAAAQSAIAGGQLHDTFYMYDLGEVYRLYKTWQATMPRIMPFYAVKCNPEPGIMHMLNALGAGFDCASVVELERALSMGVAQDRIIFANPCKRPADFRYSVAKGVQTTTFDCASELDKIAKGNPNFKLVLRIRCDDPDSKINLGLKYGAEPGDVPALLAHARRLGLEVMGVSFHVGSGCRNMAVYAEAIATARYAFDCAAAVGYNMTLLDIGGGFTAPYDGETASWFYATAHVVNQAIDTHFPPSMNVRIIAEPGRYFAESCATLFTTVLGQRRTVDESGRPVMEYWLSDGCYGSFRILCAVDGLEPNYSVLRSPLLPAAAPQDDELLPSRLWGNSDHEHDIVHRYAELPRLRDGDWLMFPYSGAYTIGAAGDYAGIKMTAPVTLYAFSQQTPAPAATEQAAFVMQEICSDIQYNRAAAADAAAEANNSDASSDTSLGADEMTNLEMMVA